MRTIRSFIEQPLQPERELVLPELVSNHVVRVLRLEIDDVFHLFNGDGFDYPCRIMSLEKRGARVRILDKVAVLNESPLRIHLYQSIARGEKMDWILQKATELGVAEFTPIVSDRTEVKLDGERSDKKLAHWQGVVRSACEQSGRAWVPAVNTPIAIHRIDAGGIAGAYYLQPDAPDGIAGLTIPEDGRLVLAIGPEGGFTERDIRLLQTAGFKGLRVGPRVLRTETAGIAVTAALQSHYGDW
jgi:16S rRNA (uracil1498-N3)-methyltransferase